MLKDTITSRDGYIVAMALLFTAEVLEKLPEDLRPDSAIVDMRSILASVPRAILDAADMDINGLLLQVDWESPDYCALGADRLASLVRRAEAGDSIGAAALCEQAESVQRSLLGRVQHDYQRNVARAAVNAVVAYLKAGQFGEPWRRHGVDMALTGLRSVGSMRQDRRQT